MRAPLKPLFIHLTMSFNFRASADAPFNLSNDGVHTDAKTAATLVTLAGLLFFGVVWIGQLWMVSIAPPEDNIEQLIWTGSLEWGYYKHPPLPTWLLWPIVKILGQFPALTFVMAGLTSLGAVAIMWRLLYRLRGSQYALAALLAALCITYYNRRLDVYNHDTVLMVIVSMSALLTWKAHQSGQLRWWAALGVCLGLGAITKYQIAVTMTCTLAFWIYVRGWKTMDGRQGFAVMCAVISLIFLPHAVWMVQHDFAPIRYAMGSSLGANSDAVERLRSASHWLAEQVFNRMAPTWLFLICATVLFKFMSPATEPKPIVEPTNPNHRDSRALLLIWGLLPLAFMPFVALVMGSHLQLRWASPFLIFAVPAIFEILHLKVTKQISSVGQNPQVPWSPQPFFKPQFFMQPVVIAFIIVQGLLLTASFLHSSGSTASLLANRSKKIDPQRLAQVLEAPARNALGGPICLVSGNTEIAGGLALVLSDRPSVLVDGQLDRSPWLSKDALLNCGILELSLNSNDPAFIALGPQFFDLSWRVIRPKP